MSSAIDDLRSGGASSAIGEASFAPVQTAERSEGASAAAPKDGSSAPR